MIKSFFNPAANAFAAGVRAHEEIEDRPFILQTETTKSDTLGDPRTSNHTITTAIPADLKLMSLQNPVKMAYPFTQRELEQHQLKAYQDLYECGKKISGDEAMVELCLHKFLPFDQETCHVKELPMHESQKGSVRRFQIDFNRPMQSLEKELFLRKHPYVPSFIFDVKTASSIVVEVDMSKKNLSFADDSLKVGVKFRGGEFESIPSITFNAGSEEEPTKMTFKIPWQQVPMMAKPFAVLAEKLGKIHYEGDLVVVNGTWSNEEMEQNFTNLQYVDDPGLD